VKVLLAFLANACVNFVIGLLIAKFLGPEEYGRFALAFAIATVAQTALYDWLRLAATRFYSGRAPETLPFVRGTLAACFFAVTGGLFVAATLFALMGPRLEFDNQLILLALLTATANGLFDYYTALARARFDDGAYSRLMLVKNFLALVFIGGGAFVFRSAGVALAGGVASLMTTVVLARAALRDPEADIGKAQSARARDFLSYSAPIVAALLLYQAIPLASRAIVAIVYDFAETGQFSLSYDIGFRAVLAFGTALDVLLFQIAVDARETQGADRAREQVAANMGIVFAILAPACVGLWIVMPSVEALLVPGQFRGPFGHYLGLLLPGLFAMALITFGLNPVFQIEKRTAPLVYAAVAAVVFAIGLLLALPWGADASNLAIAQTGGWLASLAVTIVCALRVDPVWPSFRDLALASIGTLTMYLVLSPLRSLPPGVATLLSQIGAGVLVYGLFVAIFDIARLRRPVIEWLERTAPRA
jgi:O-antigen/teichoic acid export membrane protein